MIHKKTRYNIFVKDNYLLNQKYYEKTDKIPYNDIVYLPKKEIILRPHQKKIWNQVFNIRKYSKYFLIFHRLSGKDLLASLISAVLCGIYSSYHVIYLMDFKGKNFDIFISQFVRDYIPRGIHSYNR